MLPEIVRAAGEPGGVAEPSPPHPRLAGHHDASQNVTEGLKLPLLSWWVTLCWRAAECEVWWEDLTLPSSDRPQPDRSPSLFATSFLHLLSRVWSRYWGGDWCDFGWVRSHGVAFLGAVGFWCREAALCRAAATGHRLPAADMGRLGKSLLP